MATFRAASGNTAQSAKNVSISAPTGIAAGDLMLAWVQSDNDGSFGAPAGWNLLGGAGPDAGGKDSYPSAIFYKTASGNEASSYKFTFSVNTDLTGGIIAYYNTGGSWNSVQSVSNGATNTLAANSITTTQSNETVVAWWSGVDQTDAINLPGGLTSRLNITNSAGMAMAVGDYVGPSTPGSTSPGTASITSPDTDHWAAFVVVITGTLPLAPTLTAPNNASYSDLAANGGPFSWTYNTGGASGGETGYHFRQKISGGSYNYWNATSSAFQSTDVANTSTSTTLTFPVSKFTDGNTYNWSTASVDAVGTGPYAANFTVSAQISPTVTISAPTGTQTSQTATVNWSDSLASGASQGTWRVVTYSQAQYSAAGFTPGSGPSVDDSGVQTGAATTYTTGILPNNTNYESYVQITQTPGGQASSWVFTSYTVVTDVPATPSVSAVATTDPTTGCPMVQLNITCQDNLLTANQASLANGNTTGWNAGAGTTLTAQTSPTPPTAEGPYCMRLAGSGTLSANTPTGTNGVAVLPSTQYTALASFQSASTARNCTVGISWYTSSGTLLSTSTSSAVSDASGSWAQAGVTATSPSNAAFAAVVLTVTAASENHNAVEIELVPGTDSTWSRGGLVGSTTVSILRSDGLYVRNASLANPASVPASSQTLTVNDYEVVPTISYTYTAFTSAVVNVGVTITSAGSVGATAMIAGAQGYWEFVCTNPASAVNAQPLSWNPSQLEQSAAHVVLGQATMNVVAYSVQNQDFTATFWTNSAAMYTALVSIATSQQVVFVSDPFGYGGYYRLAPAPGGLSSGMGNKAHDTQRLPGSTAAAPVHQVNVTAIAAPRPPV